MSIVESKLRKISESVAGVCSTTSANMRAVSSSLASGKAAASCPVPRASLADVRPPVRHAMDDCLAALATGSVFAGDLRFVIATIRVLHDYERMNELIAALAERDMSSSRETMGHVSDAVGFLADLNDLLAEYAPTMSPLTIGQESECSKRCFAAQTGFAVSSAEAKATVRVSIEGNLLSPDQRIDAVLACRHVDRICGLEEEIMDEILNRLAAKS